MFPVLLKQAYIVCFLKNNENAQDQDICAFSSFFFHSVVTFSNENPFN